MSEEEKWECYPKGRGTECHRKSILAPRDVYVSKKDIKKYETIRRKKEGVLSRQKPFFFINLVDLNQYLLSNGPHKLDFKDFKKKLQKKFGLTMMPEVRFYFPTQNIPLHNKLKKLLEDHDLQYGEGGLYIRETNDVITRKPPDFYLFEKGTTVQMIVDLTVLGIKQVYDHAFVLVDKSSDNINDYNVPVDFLNERFGNNIKILDFSELEGIGKKRSTYRYLEERFKEIDDQFTNNVKNYSSVRYHVGDEIKNYAYVYNASKTLTPAAIYIDYYNIYLSFQRLKSQIRKTPDRIESLHTERQGNAEEFDQICKRILMTGIEGVEAGIDSMLFSVITDYFKNLFNLVEMHVFMGLHPIGHEQRVHQRGAVDAFKKYGYIPHFVPMRGGWLNDFEESGVDELMAAKIIYDAYSHKDPSKNYKREPYRPELIKKFIILTDDVDFFPVYSQLSQDNKDYHIWSFGRKSSKSSEYERPYTPKWLARIFGLGERGGEGLLQRYKRNKKVTKERHKYNLDS